MTAGKTNNMRLIKKRTNFFEEKGKKTHLKKNCIE
jgi:hypothetical protein